MREGQKRDVARALRRDSTDAERKMWRLLRDRRLDGVEFRRQVPIGPFIADFVSIEHGLVLQLDGGQHAKGA
jgi:very-short-patch-repair endonuclease